MEAAWLSQLGVRNPFAALEARGIDAPEPQGPVLVHQDFRTGNYMVDRSGLTGILDWEFCDWGDPMSDIGWFCAACWRFGHGDLEAGGIAPRGPFYHGYEGASGRSIDSDAVAFWETMAHIRWAVIALQQGERTLSGGEDSLELALTGRVSPHTFYTICENAELSPWQPYHASRGFNPEDSCVTVASIYGDSPTNGTNTPNALLR